MISIELPDGQILQFETDDPELAKDMVDDLISSGEIQMSSEGQRSLGESVPAQLGNLGMEGVSSFWRGLTGMVDTLGTDTFNSIMQRAGSDFRAPQLQDMLNIPEKGEFAGKGLATDIASGFTEGATMAATGYAGLSKAAANMLPGTAKNVTQAMAGASPVTETALGALGGSAAELGRVAGGTPGAIAAGVLAPMKMTPTSLPDVNPALKKATEEDILKNITRGEVNKLEDIFNINPQAAQDIKDLGMENKPLASYISDNPQFVSLEMGMSAMSESVLNQNHRAFISEFSEKGDEMLRSFGAAYDETTGKINFSKLNQSFDAKAMEDIKGIEESENLLYNQAKEIAPLNTKFQTPNVQQLAMDMAEELGGEQNLPDELDKLFKNLSQEGGSTLGYLNSEKRRLWKGMKNQGAFGDADSALVKQMYGAIKRDLDEGLSQIPGGKEIVDTANKLTIKRKGIEDSLQKLFTNNLSKNIVNVVSKGVKSASGGDIKTLKNTMNLVSKIPSANRQELVMTALYDSMRGTGKQSQTLDVTKFSNFMDGLNANPQAKKEIYRLIPKGAQTNLDKFHRISKRISTGLSDKITTGMSRRFQDLDKGIMRKLLGAIGTKLGVAADVASMGALSPAKEIAASFLRDIMKAKTSRLNKALDLLSSKEFAEALESNKFKKLKQTKVYKSWLKEMPPEVKNQIFKTSFRSYLLNEEEK